MRDLVAKSTNPESAQPGSIPSPPPDVRSAEPNQAPGVTPAAGAGHSPEPPTSLAEPAAAPASYLVDAQPFAGSPEIVPGPTRLHLVAPLIDKRGPRIDEAGRRLAHIHTLFRAPSGCKYLDRRPLLRLSGTWLHEAGFPAGQPIAVRIEPGRLVIERSEKDPPFPAIPAGRPALGRLARRLAPPRPSGPAPWWKHERRASSPTETEAP